LATLLHLSDLHLGDEDYSTFADYKVEVIAPAARQGRSFVLASTLRALGEALLREGVRLDAVAISGDVTYRGQASGFARLPEMLANLGEAAPDPSRIMVVPGNHDVMWGSEPGSSERYADFIAGVRNMGYVTPLLEGIDLTDEGSSEAGAKSPLLTASDNSFMLVGLNSSDHCGVQARTDPELEAAIAAVEADETNTAAQAVLKAWRRSNQYDVARVSPAQRVAVSRELGNDTDRTDGPVLIAVLHHQLLPISLEEEVKPFEAIVNLAQVRDWLAINGFGMVLHGHKHVSVTYEDRYMPLAHSVFAPHRVIVSSVGTVGQGQGMTNVIGRLITVVPSRASVGKVLVKDVTSVSPGASMDYSILVSAEYRTRVDSATNGSHLIEGSGSRQVHEQLLDLTDDGLELPRPLVCRVTVPEGAQKPPASYAGLGSIPEDEAWFEDLVGLWQNREPLTAMAFNHGERIFALNGDTNQFDLALAALAAKQGSSRAVISVFNPGKDKPAESSKDFPSFCLVHLFIVKRELRVVAYFRKQEMRYWWPVNLAELARLQHDAVSRLNAQQGYELVPGEITTITAIPTSGRQIPRVAVPRVDRWVDEDPARLLRMSLLPYQPTMPEGSAALADWRILTDECHLPSTGAADGSPVPVLGLTRVHENIAALKSSFGELPLAKKLERALSASATYNRLYRDASRSHGAEEELRQRVNEGHDQIAECLDELRSAVQANGVTLKGVETITPDPPPEACA
jgi:3',5'-cyclic AMP phosphodiesterase CpdA